MLITDRNIPFNAIKALRFENLLNALCVGLDKPTDRGGLVGSFSCTRVLLLTTAEAAELFGPGGYCTFPAPNELKAVLGTGATVLPGASLALKPGVLKAAGVAHASLFAPSVATPVGQPLVPTVPAVVLAASSTTVRGGDAPITPLASKPLPPR